jgi:hypothetical protein
MTAATIDPRLPLSLLEAVRVVDTPTGEVEREYIEELRNKRLGLSDTVYAQIKRYTAAVARREPAARDDAEALARLISRRTDAHLVFESAGQLLAREAVGTVSPLRRRAIRALPGLVARPMALGAIKRIARRYLDAHVTRIGASLVMRVKQPVLSEGPTIAGYAFYASALATMLELVTGQPAVVTRVDSTNDGHQWKAAWGRA